MSEQPELLFFDTFSHNNSEEINLDLVQFPKPVYIDEIRIIPLGARVQADFPGGVRLGATNPSQFSVEFFVNDLGQQGVCTFESLGKFEYNQNDCIHLECTKSENLRLIPTDGLVLKGLYNTITLAVYGRLPIVLPESPQTNQTISTPTIPPQQNQPVVVEQKPQSLPKQEPPNQSAQKPAQWQSNVEYPATQPSNTTTPQTYPVVPNTTDVSSSFQKTESFTNIQEFNNYYNRDQQAPKDPRCITNPSTQPSIPYHLHTNDDWQPPPTEAERNKRHNERRYARSRSRDREHSSRDFSSRESSREKEWDRYKRNEYDREHSSHSRTKHRQPRTPPPKSSSSSPRVRRPHTPSDNDHYLKEYPNSDIDSIISDDDVSQKLRKSRKSSSIQKESLFKEKKRESFEKENDNSQEQFEPILSDEEICDEIVETPVGQYQTEMEFDYTDYLNNDDLLKSFNPFESNLTKFEQVSLFDEIKTYFNNIDCNHSTENELIDKLTKHFDNDTSMKRVHHILCANNFSDFETLSDEEKEEWVQTCDQITILLSTNKHLLFYFKLKQYLNKFKNNFIENIDQYQDFIKVTNRLIDWIKIGLNFDYALQQKQPGFKIRHIKCGIRLTDTLIVHEHIFDQLNCVQLKLLELYDKEFMALSIKLMILKAIDKSLLNRSGIMQFISTSRGSKNCYEMILELLLKNPLVRVKFAITSILTKVHLYETVDYMRMLIDNWFGTTDSLKEEVCHTTCVTTITSDDIFLFAQCLQSLLNNLRDAFSVAQPKRFLPVSSQFELVNRSASKEIFFVLFDAHRFLQIALILLVHKNCTNFVTILSNVIEIFYELMIDEESLNFLMDNIQTVDLISKALLQGSTNELDACSTKTGRLGLILSYKMQALYHLNAIKSLNELESIDHWHQLYCLTLSNIGKQAVAEVFNLRIYQFMPYLEKLIDNDNDNDVQKSPTFEYFIDLLHNMFLFSNRVEHFDVFAKTILRFVVMDRFLAVSDDMRKKLNDIYSYLKPFEIANVLQYDDISGLCNIVKSTVITASKCPQELIMALRIINYLGIPSNENSLIETKETTLSFNELKYKHVILQLYSLDGVTNLLNILKRICQLYEQPNLHVSLFVTQTIGVQILQTLFLSLNLVRRMLTCVIQCPNTNYKDLTPIQTILQVYTLAQTYSIQSIGYLDACQVMNVCIETLMVFTMSTSEEYKSGDSLSKSLWSQMLSEVIKYIIKAPYLFISGLSILSELLPLPLPIQTRTPLTDIEQQKIMIQRKLWSAHLHPHINELSDVITTLMTTNCPTIISLLRRVCIQISDLTATVALKLTRDILNKIILKIDEKLMKNDDDCITHELSRLLNFLLNIITNGTIKSAVLHLISSKYLNSGVDEHFSSLVDHLVQILSDSPIQLQECVINIIQTLCDNEITLYTNKTSEMNETESDIYLSNALPQKDILNVFINALLQLLITNETNFATILPIVQTFLLLAEHDYGFVQMKHAFDNFATKPFALCVFNKLLKNFARNNTHYLSTLNIVLEFLKVCLTNDYIQLEPNIMFFPRKAVMSVKEMRNYCDWLEKDNEDHPINKLVELLNSEETDDDDVTKTLKSNVVSLQQILTMGFINVSGGDEETITTGEIVLPNPDNFQNQFSARQLYVITKNVSNDRMSARYLLCSNDVNGDMIDVEQIGVDLNELCKELLPASIDLCQEIDKLCHITSNNDKIDDTKRPSDSLKYSTVIGEKLYKPFVTPGRGRGYLRTLGSSHTNLVSQSRTVGVNIDPFRSRPPNTSRPPSLHVDDFVALETCGAQPTAPTGYNKLSREIMNARTASGISRTVSSSTFNNTSGQRTFIMSDPHFRQFTHSAVSWPGGILEQTSSGQTGVIIPTTIQPSSSSHYHLSKPMSIVDSSQIFSQSFHAESRGLVHSASISGRSGHEIMPVVRQWFPR